MEKITISFLTLLCSVVASGQQSAYTVKLNRELSSASYDFGANYIDDSFRSIILSSSRDDLKDNDGITLFHLYYSSLADSGEWRTPVPIDPDRNKSSDAFVSADNKRNVLFLTKCPEAKRKDRAGCQIYYTYLQGGMMGAFMPLNIEVPKDKNIIMGQPSFSNELDILFFTANEWPGGYGGDDIWFAKYDRSSDTWGTPQNLGAEVNTSKHEFHPFIHQDGTLYFTTNRPHGHGGWDIVKAKRTGDFMWGNVESMPAPINSKEDDFGIVFRGNSDSGFFASTRKGGFGEDDIYEFSSTESSAMNTQTSSNNRNTLESLSSIFNQVECVAEYESLKLEKIKCDLNANPCAFTLEFFTNQKADLTVRTYSTEGELVRSEALASVSGQFTKDYTLPEGEGIYYVQILYDCEVLWTKKLIVK